MPASDQTKTLLLDEAQTFIQTRGHNGFSIRDLAQKVGIKAASIYHHFPNKTDLVASVAHRYTDDFLQALSDKAHNDASAEQLLEIYISLFRQALVEGNRMCLCGALAAEIDALPEKVLLESRRFFDLNIEWLSAVFAKLYASHNISEIALDARARSAAIRFLSALEGAMLMARVSADPQTFEETAKNLVLSMK